MNAAQRAEKSRRARVLCSAVAGAALLNSAAFVQGINITLSYDAANSSPPASDPGGAQLQAIMNHVRSVYNDIFEDTHNITITYRWGTPSNPSAIAAHSLVSQGGSPNRETAGSIVFRNTTAWFFDATPADNSEFNMTQTLWRDLTATQRNNFYSNFGVNIPSTFEVGFTGGDNGSNPNVAGNTDLLSVAFHEVGHALGMSASNTATQAQTADGDYDFNTAFVFGQTLAADVATGGNIAHLNDSFALMFPSIGTAERNLPSHTDLFSMASGHAYTLLDVPRREFYGGSDWNTAGNWSGNQIPGSLDEVFVRASGPNGEIRTAGLSASGFANILHVAEGSNVETNNFSLSVGSQVNLTGVDTDLFVETGGTLSAASATVNINDQAELSMLGGVATVGTINNNAEIIGRGTINFSGRLTNSGSINVSGGSLLLNATGAASINLDGNAGTFLGSEPGVVNVTSAGTSLTINGLLTDDFNGDINVGNSNSITFNNPWTLGGQTGTIIFSPDGQLNLNGGTTSATAAVLNGALVTVEGDVNVGTNNFGIINAPASFVSGEIHIQSGGTLRLDGAATFNGGTYDGAGTIQFDGNTTIVGNTTFDIANFDFDGAADGGTFTINDGVTMTVNGDVTDAYGENLVVNGNLFVNGPSWGIGILNGSITLSTAIIGGTAPFSNNVGNLTVLAGTSTISTASNFAFGNNTINGILRLTGNSTIAGGTWSGTGTLSLDDQSTTFTASTTLNFASFNMDGLVAGTGSVNINAGITVFVGGAITDVFDATLNVNTGTFNSGTNSWTASGTINLTGGPSAVAALTGPGLTTASDNVINITGGTVANFAPLPEDENNPTETVSGGGRIATGTFTNSGTINVNANSGGVITGTTIFNSNSRVSIAAGGELVLLGATTFNGGSYTGAGVLTQSGNATFAANTVIAVDTYDWDGDITSSTTVNSGVNLTINAATIENDPPGGHDGTVTLDSATLTVNTAAPWIKGGTMFMINSGAGTPTVAGQDMILTGQINVTGAAQMTAGLVNGGGTLNTTAGATMTNTGAFRTTSVNTFTKVGPGTWNINGPQSHAAGSILNINAGNVSMASDAGAGGQNLTINHNGSALTFNATQRLLALNVGTGATATQNAAGNTNFVRVLGYSIAGPVATPAGTINLGDDMMIVDYSGASPLATVTSHLTAGFNAGNWNGAGIRSSDAALLPNNFALGVIENSDIGSPATFAGQPVDATTIIVRYTRQGDANLDRTTNITDFSLLGPNFNLPGRWHRGDFNYSGAVTIADFSLLAANFNTVVTAELPRGGLVPEPAAAGALAGLLALRRRRRRA